jgi:hypothetical protein
MEIETMNLKNMFLMLLTGLLALASLSAVLFYFTQPGATAVAESQPPEIPAQVKSDFEDDMVGTEIAREEKKWPSATSNGITVQITSVKLTQVERLKFETDKDGNPRLVPGEFDLVDALEIGMCYTAPDDGEWRIFSRGISFGDYQIFDVSYEIFEGEKLADGKEFGMRCGAARYLLQDGAKSLVMPVRYSIEFFSAAQRENHTPCQEIQQRWRTNPLAQEYGMKISCQDDFAKGPTVTLDDYSKSVNREDAQWVFDMLTTAQVPGHWEFVLTEIEP